VAYIFTISTLTHMSHWTEKLIDFCKLDSVTDQNEINRNIIIKFSINQNLTFYLMCITVPKLKKNRLNSYTGLQEICLGAETLCSQLSPMLCVKTLSVAFTPFLTAWSRIDEGIGTLKELSREPVVFCYRGTQVCRVSFWDVKIV
jgi:hypothetical protein